MNLEVLSGQTQVSCSDPAPAQEYSDPPLLIGFTNLQLAGLPLGCSFRSCQKRHGLVSQPSHACTVENNKKLH
jgi:hypothetical protein